MTLSLQKATQKPSWGSLDETDSAITTTELTGNNQTAQGLSHTGCRIELQSYDGASSIQGLSAIFLHPHNRRHELVVTEPYETNGRRSITVDMQFHA